MKSKKILKYIVDALAGAGFFVMWFAVGTCDYMVEIGEYYPLSETVKLLGLAFLLEVPIIISHIIKEGL